MMGERIKELRKELGMNQVEFSKALSLSQSAIANYENDTRMPNNAVLKLIAEKFNVNPSWLHDGIGDMFVQKTRDEEIEKLIEQTMTDEPDSFRRRLIAALSHLGTDEWKVLEKMALELAASHEENAAANEQQAAADPQRDLERQKLHDEIDRQLDLEDAAGGSQDSSAG